MPAHQHRSIRQFAPQQKAQPGQVPCLKWLSGRQGIGYHQLPLQQIPICLSRDRNRAHLVAEPIKPIL